MFSHPKTSSDQLCTQRKGGTCVGKVAASILQVQPRARLRGETHCPLWLTRPCLWAALGACLQPCFFNFIRLFGRGTREEAAGMASFVILRDFMRQGAPASPAASPRCHFPHTSPGASHQRDFPPPYPKIKPQQLKNVR